MFFHHNVCENLDKILMEFLRIQVKVHMEFSLNWQEMSQNLDEKFGLVQNFSQTSF